MGAREPVNLSNVDYVPIEEIPSRVRFGKWIMFFNKLSDGKVALLKYNNRQRALLVRHNLRQIAMYYGITSSIKTRTIHETDEWLLYIWRVK